MILLHITESTLSDNFSSYTYFPIYASKPVTRLHGNILKAQNLIQRDNCRSCVDCWVFCSVFKDRHKKIPLNRDIRRSCMLISLFHYDANSSQWWCISQPKERCTEGSKSYSGHTKAMVDLKDILSLLSIFFLLQQMQQNKHLLAYLGLHYGLNNCSST